MRIGGRVCFRLCQIRLPVMVLGRRCAAVKRAADRRREIRLRYGFGLDHTGGLLPLS